MMHGDPAVVSSFRIVTSSEVAKQCFCDAVARAVSGVADEAACADAAARFVAALPLDDNDSGDSSVGVSAAMIERHCMYYAEHTTHGVKCFDATGGRAADLVDSLLDCAVPVSLTTQCASDVIVAKGVQRALAMPLSRVLRVLGFAQHEKAVRASGVTSTGNLLWRTEFGMVSQNLIKHVHEVTGSNLCPWLSTVRHFFATTYVTTSGIPGKRSLHSGMLSMSTAICSICSRCFLFQEAMEPVLAASDACAIFQSVFDELPGSTLERRFTAAVPLGAVSAWQVIDVCECNEDDPEAAIAAVEALSGPGAKPAASDGEAPRPSQAIGPWLVEIGLGEFEPIFAEQGFQRVADAQQLTEEHLQELGLSKLGQRRRFARGIKQLAA